MPFAFWAWNSAWTFVGEKLGAPPGLVVGMGVWGREIVAWLLFWSCPQIVGAQGYLSSLRPTWLSCVNSRSLVWLPKGLPGLTLRDSDLNSASTLHMLWASGASALSSPGPLTCEVGAGVRLALEGDSC